MMHYSYSVAAGLPGTALPVPAISVVLNAQPARRAEADRRWPAVLRKLAALRRRGRRSVRIVDASCGAGELLIQAARRARALGFVAIEARGIDRDPAMVARARIAARLAVDAAIGLDFDVGEPQLALDDETDFPADIVLYVAPESDLVLRRAAIAAGTTVLGVAATHRWKVAA